MGQLHPDRDAEGDTWDIGADEFAARTSGSSLPLSARPAPDRSEESPSEDDDDPTGAAQLERQQRLERDLSTRVIALLEPVVGAERVRVNVALKLNPQTSEETEERYDPNTVVRSRQISSDQANLPGALGQVAGARSNLPPQPSDPKPVAAAVAGAGSSRTAETTNYEVSKTTRRVIRPPGEIARLSVAVILDDDQQQKTEKDGTVKHVRVPRQREELQKIHGLVAAAVGFDMMRGDQLTVENVSFDEPAIEDEAPPSIFVRYAPQITEFGRLATVLLIGLAGFFFVIRPLLRAGGFCTRAVAVAGDGAIEVQRPRTVADLQSEIEAQLDAEVAERATVNLKLPVLTKRVSAITQKEPEQVAKLFPDSAYQLTHNALFPKNCMHIENLGGDIDAPELQNKRLILGCFPWKFKGGEAAFCRAVAFTGDWKP